MGNSSIFLNLIEKSDASDDEKRSVIEDVIESQDNGDSDDIIYSRIIEFVSEKLYENGLIIHLQDLLDEFEVKTIEELGDEIRNKEYESVRESAVEELKLEIYEEVKEDLVSEYEDMIDSLEEYPDPSNNYYKVFEVVAEDIKWNLVNNATFKETFLRKMKDDILKVIEDLNEESKYYYLAIECIEKVKEEMTKDKKMMSKLKQEVMAEFATKLFE